jgi:hypothetical protein
MNEMAKKKQYLTKSRYIKSLDCSTLLWKSVFEPLPYDPPQEGSIEAIGTDIGIHAHQLIPGGALIDEEPWQHTQAVERTESLLHNKNIPAIYEAAFEYENIRVRVDILERLPRNQWGLREVKSSTKVKDHYYDDVALQLYVLQGVGLKVSSVELIHVDKEYVRQGDIDWSAYFKRAELIDDLPDLDELEANALDAQRILRKTKCPDPVITIACKSCDYWDSCCGHLPTDWVGFLPDISKGTKYDQLCDLGISSVSEIPDDFPLTAKQETIRKVVQSGEDYISRDLPKALKQFSRPAYYLDFETTMPAIPLYDGTSPYEVLQFQWSLHHVNRNKKAKHWEFLADDQSAEDPSRAFAESLIDALAGNEQKIVVYSSYEKTQLNALIRKYPDLADELNAIIARLEDLLVVTRGYTYLPGYRYSDSIKTVGPTLAPQISYKELDLVSEGQGAATAFQMLVAGELEGNDREAIRSALLEYCKLDTWAMVQVHQALMDFN